MKNYPLLKGTQKGIDFFTVVCDPRIMIKLVDIPEKDTNQDTQRPWKESRVKEISKYVAGKMNMSEDSGRKENAKGIIPNCPILNIKHPYEVAKSGNSFSIQIPETASEIASYKGKVEILDGQHRMIAFSEEYIDMSFKNEETYEMTFVLFQDLTMELKRELFMITNEKQDKPEANILRTFRRMLGLLSPEDEMAYQLILKLNSESASKLAGRIIVGGVKVKKGLKLNEMTKIFKKTGTMDIIKIVKVDAQFKIITEYLNAWDEVYNGKFNAPNHILGKISGFRYIFGLMPYINGVIVSNQKKWDRENLVDILKELYQISDSDHLFTGNASLAFRSEGGTLELAKIHGEMLKEHYRLKGAFNPFEGL